MELSIIVRNVLLGGTLLGALGGMVGSFALLRRQSLLGDALAHAALPGVCVAFLITGSKHPAPLLLGAMVAGVLGALFMVGVTRWSRIKEDAAMGIVLSVFFGAGIVLLTVIQRLPGGNKAGLDHFLFGQAATLMRDDIRWMAILGVGALLVVLLFYKELQLLAFDPAFGASLGLPMRAIEILLTVLIVVVVVVGLQMVGVILMVAALVIPAAAARQWTQRLGTMLFAAAGFGAVTGALGALSSALVEDFPTGPAIVILSSAVLVVSLLLAPQRGMLWRWLRARRLAGRIRREHLLKDLYRIGERREDWGAGLALPELLGKRGQAAGRAAARNARELVRAGLLARRGDEVQLTRAGQDAAENLVRKHRLWEVYLTRRMDLADDHVHRDAEDMEHALSDQAAAELDERLGYPTTDPHGRPIPRSSAA